MEDAIRAGDAIGGAGWTLWVREGASCHSACVLILAAGDMRVDFFMPLTTIDKIIATSAARIGV